MLNQKHFSLIKKVQVREYSEDLDPSNLKISNIYLKLLKKQDKASSKKWKATFEISWIVVEVLQVLEKTNKIFGFKRGKEGACELETNVISIPGKTNKQKIIIIDICKYLEINETQCSHHGGLLGIKCIKSV